MLGSDDLNDLIIAENKSFDFSNIKNTTEIYGKSIKAHYTASTCTIDQESHTLTLGFLLSTMETLENNKKYELIGVSCTSPHFQAGSGTMAFIPF